ncbi:MAG: Ig-like domain-containing protein [Defluviitaleaceae bacterium]|nr:Ig-like domain-containing protein [Defluviitaleaceae bacterium]
MRKKIIAASVASLLFAVIAAVFVTSHITGRTNYAPDEIITSEVVASERAFRTATSLSAVAAAAMFSADEIGEILDGQDPRGGYVLAPTHVGRAGVDSASSFVLRVPIPMRRGWPDLPHVTIDGQDPPTITREGVDTFLITPALALTPNSVYVFRVTCDDGPEITWAFQTAILFEITGTLPRNQATNVPVRTGVEINFSYGEEIDISELFSIYPHAEGRFIHRDSTAIFMPINPLEHSTVYTVTLRAGASYLNETIGSERVFSFETAPVREAGERPQPASRVHFSRNYVEFPSFDVPHVNFWLSHSGQTARPPIEFSLYRIDDRAIAIDAVTRLSGVHSWSHFSDGRHIIDTDDLTRLSHETVNAPERNRWNERYTLPDLLPPGFYVLHAATAGESVSQVVIQITDTATQIFADADRAIVWLNDMHTGRPISGASVYDPVTRSTINAAEYGVAVIERGLSVGDYLIAGDSVIFIHQGGMQSFWNHWWSDDVWDMPVSRSFGGGWNSTPSSHNDYWTALQLDRTLFQRDDTVHLWGFVQNRRTDENINHVTAVLTEGSWWGRGWSNPNRDILHRVNVPVNYGAFSGEIRLPHIDPGSYEISIYHGDVLLSSMFFTVQDYVKPPYQMTVSASHAAIFAGQEVTFTANTAFFEGTPVPDLDISHRFWGHQLGSSQHGRGQTNIDGVIEVSTRPTAQAPTRNSPVQGERRMEFTAETTLPEIGWTQQRSSVRVFVNDINVRPRAHRDGANATLSVDVHNITLDRINDGTAARWSDFLGAPRSGQNISVEIVEVYWERVREGEFYDHVTRQTRPRYRHVRRENSLQTFTLTTNADGFAERNFTVPNIERRSYIARITTRDGNGRNMYFNTHIGRNWDSFFNSANDNRLFLYGADPAGYDIGDDVELTIMRGAERVEQGNFLFVVVQGGVISYHVGTNPLQFTFGEQHVPNAQVFAVHFNGHTYHSGGQMSQRLRFNPASRELLIEITTCAEYYRPGEVPTFTIRTTDLAGNPKAANVNISLVDEALFALMDYNVDTLAMLYANVGDNLRFAMATHRTFVSDGIEDTDDVAEDAELQADFAAGAPMPAMAGDDSAARGRESGGEDARIRERFEDTAFFASVRTNANGTATLTFPLPDNVTSWRATASGISTDLYAGNIVQNVRVTLPMFLHYTLNRVFLTGDVPTIGVNAFGTALAGGERVEFTVYRQDAPDDVRRGSGAAFERVNIPLWEMSEEGSGAIIIRAVVAGHGDAVRHDFTVVNSHRHIDNAVFYTVTPATQFEINETGLTNITFTDHGRGQFLNSLFSLRQTWWSGARIEGLVARREADAMIRAHFPDVRTFGNAGAFDVTDYQTQSGGLAVLPYSDAELPVTVKLLPFVQDEINLHAMRNYLRNIAETSPTDNRMLALYGLALLGEPVLHDLQRYAMLEDLSVRNTAYLALAFAALGETHIAHQLYDERIAPHVQRVAPYYRVNAGANRAQILDATSATALLAAELGLSEAIGLHNYAVTNRAAAIGWPRFGGGRRDTLALNAQLLLNLETLNFISREIKNHNASEASITYSLFGDTVTRNLGHGGSFTLRIPAQNFDQFRLISTAGEVGAVSVIRVPLEEIEAVENDITIRRQFFRGTSNLPATTFAQDEIIRVQITVDYSARDLTGTYVITDFLPAGLVLVQDSARIGRGNNVTGRRAWAQTEGQRVTFFDHNGRFDREHVYYYYARVINPGTFRAEGTIVQSLGAREYMVIGEDTVITIE